jgi:hypothetical protein
MKHLLLQNSNIFLVNCTIEPKRIKVGYGEFGYNTQGNTATVSCSNSDRHYKIVIPKAAVNNDSGSFQCNFYLELVKDVE